MKLIYHVIIVCSIILFSWQPISADDSSNRFKNKIQELKQQISLQDKRIKQLEMQLNKAKESIKKQTLTSDLDGTKKKTGTE